MRWDYSNLGWSSTKRILRNEELFSSTQPLLMTMDEWRAAAWGGGHQHLLELQASRSADSLHLRSIKNVLTFMTIIQDYKTSCNIKHPPPPPLPL